MTLLAAGTPACATSVFVAAEKDGSNKCSYEVQAPSDAQVELARGFRRAVKKLGYDLSDLLGKLTFEDKKKNVEGWLFGSIVFMVVSEPDGPRETARRIAALTNLDAVSSLDDVLGETVQWVSVRFDRTSGDDLGLMAELHVVGSIDQQHAVIDGWAKERGVSASTPREWLRKVDEAAPSGTAVVIDLLADGKLRIFEARKGHASLPACEKHGD
jgi:hypothetical protein